MTKLKLEYPAGSPTTTLEFTYALQMDPPLWSAISGSVVDESFGGNTYSYNKGTPRETIPLKIDLLTMQDRDDLINFIENVVYGSFNVFRFTDHDGEENDVRFFDQVFDFGDGTVPYSITIELLKVLS